ncbi:MAG: DUF615 domain-containing protein [Gammaproteobacteria bacterium]|nr:DUF615 domain-containing protein [Gammaproteobacteria bacterium]
MTQSNKKNRGGKREAMGENDTPNEHQLDEDTSVSKSARKRQMHHLQQLGTALVDISPVKLEPLQLSNILLEAIALARNARKNEAKRRQLQFIGKLMRKEDPAVVARIEQMLADLHKQQHSSTQQHHNIERWRDRLLDNPNQAIEQLVAEYTHADRQWLRQICRQHQQETKQQQPPVAARKLFKYLRDLLENQA